MFLRTPNVNPLGILLEDARYEPPRHPAVPVSKKQEVLKLLHPSTFNRTDRGAIRPHGGRNETGIRKILQAIRQPLSYYPG